jgi:RHS repeat-associated protein
LLLSDDALESIFASRRRGGGQGNWHELGSYQNISYTYVNDTRLASVSGIGHTYRVFYDALGRCVVRTMDGSTSCYVYDGEKPIVEYGPAFVKTAANIYGRGIDEILQRTDYTASPARTLYYQDDHEGNVTHLMMQISNTPTVVESYRYDAFGKPTITNTSGIVTNNRFMFTGREYVSQFGIYEYRNRAYHPGLGRFMSEDPKGFAAGDYNLFRYCHNDPIDFTDPMGLYVMSTDPEEKNAKISEKEKNQFEEAQKAEIERFEKASNQIDKALAKGGKLLSDAKKSFELVFGPKSGTAQNMSKVSQSLRSAVAAMRDKGTKGYIAYGSRAQWFRENGYDPKTLFGLGNRPGKTIRINLDHRYYQNEYSLAWDIGHESLHNVGIHDQAYKHKESERYDALTTDERLDNVDSYVDFASSVSRGH